MFCWDRVQKMLNLDFPWYLQSVHVNCCFSRLSVDVLGQMEWAYHREVGSFT